MRRRFSGWAMPPATWAPLCRQLGRARARRFVFAHSLGAAAALRQHRRLPPQSDTVLVLLAPAFACTLQPWAQTVLRAVRWLPDWLLLLLTPLGTGLAWLAEGRGRTSFRAFARRHRPPDVNHWLRRLRRMAAAGSPRAPRTLPPRTIVVLGARDPVVSPTAALRWAPDAVVLPDAGHLLHETHAAAVVTALAPT